MTEDITPLLAAEDENRDLRKELESIKKLHVTEKKMMNERDVVQQRHIDLLADAVRDLGGDPKKIIQP